MKVECFCCKKFTEPYHDLFVFNGEVGISQTFCKKCYDLLRDDDPWVRYKKSKSTFGHSIKRR